MLPARVCAVHFIHDKELEKLVEEDSSGATMRDCSACDSSSGEGDEGAYMCEKTGDVCTAGRL